MGKRRAGAIRRLALVLGSVAAGGVALPAGANEIVCIPGLNCPGQGPRTAPPQPQPAPAPPPQPAPRPDTGRVQRFETPTLPGGLRGETVYLERCHGIEESRTGSACGDAAAHAFCAARQLGSAVRYALRPARPEALTYMAGDNAIRTANPGADRPARQIFAWIECGG